MKLAIGIDFGTTNSCVALLQNRQQRVIPNAEGENTTPSIVGFLDGEEKVVGVAAKRQALANPERTIASVKRFLGRTMDEVSAEQAIVPYGIAAGKNGAVRVEIDGQEYAPEQIGSFVLAKIKADVEDFVGHAISDVVITVPAYFNDAQRQAVMNAGAIAGLNVVRLLNEPTAAALAYGYDGGKDSGRVMVFDLGGGTFDVSVLEIGDGVFEVLATSGDNHLGGDDFDKAVVDWLIKQFAAENGIDLAADPLALQRLYDAAERAKKELSSSPSTEVNLPFLCADERGPHHLIQTLTRSQLQKLIRPLLERLVGPIESCLKAAKLDPEQIDDVILVGGMTRMPAVQAKVEELIGREPHRGINPDEAVALGAAIQASIILGDIQDIVLLDVTPLSLGVEITAGSTEQLIPANSSVPNRVSQIFTTGDDDQRSVEVRVVQGERELARDNRLLGKVQLLEIPPAPRGRPDIEVSFELSVDGLLSVSARDLSTGNEQRMVIESATNLSPEEIERMRREARRFAESDKKARALAELRNDTDLLREQIEALIEGAGVALSADDANALATALHALEAGLAKPESPEEILIRRQALVAAVIAAKQSLGETEAPPVRARGRRRKPLAADPQ